MFIFAFDVKRTVNNETELEKALSELAAQGLGSFLLAEKDGSFPMLAVAVDGELATLMYFPQEDDPGWRSLGSILGQQGESLFCLQGPGLKEPVPNRFVISYSQAVGAAKEFFRVRRLPSSVSWLDL
jgi:hypothetical protein